MSFNAQVKQIAEEAVDGVKTELLKALEAAEARIEALEAKLGGSPDETETAAKAPRRGRKPAADPAPEPEPADKAAEAEPADAKSTGA